MGGVERSVIVEPLIVVFPDHMDNGGEEVVDGKLHVVAVDEVTFKFEEQNTLVDEMGVSRFRISEKLIEGGVPGIYLVSTAYQKMFGIFHFVAQVTAIRFNMGQASLVQSELVGDLVVK